MQKEQTHASFFSFLVVMQQLHLLHEEIKNLH